MNSPADVDNDLPINDQVLEPVAIENMDYDLPINQPDEPQLVSLQPVNDDTEMEVNQPTQLVSLQPIDPSQHDLMLEGENDDSEMEDNSQIQPLTNLEVNRIKKERIDIDEEFVNLNENCSIDSEEFVNLEQTSETIIDLNEGSEIVVDLNHTTGTISLDQTNGTVDLNSTISSKLPDYEDDDVKPNIEQLSLQEKIAYLEEPMSDEEDVKPNIEELNLAFNINHLDHLDINQTSNDAKPQKSTKTTKSKSKSKSKAPAEPINSAQVIQIIENDQVVQIINMEEVRQTSTSTIVENNGKVIQVTNVEQVIENNQVVHVLNMDESISTDSDQQTENTAPNQPIVINIPAISSQPSSSQKSPTLSQSSQSNSAGGSLKRKNITEKQKHLIEFLHLENGLTAEQIRNHDKLRREDGSRILLKTIKYWLDRLKKTGEMQTKHRSGRPRFLDSEKEKQLLEYIDSHTKKNYHMVKIEKQLQCTRRTINNYALRNGIKAYRALKKPSLNDFQKKRRLLFCEEWLQRFDDCQKIIFTDEKLFNGQPTNTYQLVRRRKGERFLEENISHTIRPQPKTSTNIWVYIGPFGKGEIFLAENDEYFDDDGNKIKKAKHGTTSFFNAISYRNMLEKRAIPSIKDRIDDFIFQQDNASIHCAKNESKTDTLVGELLKKEGITTMYWPPLSPDLNPVENVHHLLQVELNKELTTLDIKPKNKADVFALCKECWERVDNNVVKKIYFSFYSRLEKVKERNGANNY